MSSWQIVRLFAGSFILVSLLFGIGVSTLLTLVVIPVLHVVVHRRRFEALPSLPPTA